MHCFALIALAVSAASGQIDYTKDFSKGRITWYAQSNYVACDIPRSEWPQYTAALSEKHFQNGIACGATARLRNGTKEIEVMIVDLCPVQGNEQWCSGDLTHFDLGNTSTFSQLEDVSKGVTELQFKWIPTPVGDKPVRLRLKEGGSKYWIALQVLNHRYPVAKVEVKNPASGAWETGSKPNNMWNYWVFKYTGDGLSVPYPIRITDQFGQVIEETGTTIEEKTIWEGTHQFPIWPGTVTVDLRHAGQAGRGGEARILPCAGGELLQCTAGRAAEATVIGLSGRQLVRLRIDRQSRGAVLPQLPAGIYHIQVAMRGGRDRTIRWVTVR